MQKLTTRLAARRGKGANGRRTATGQNSKLEGKRKARCLPWTARAPTPTRKILLVPGHDAFSCPAVRVERGADLGRRGGAHTGAQDITCSHEPLQLLDKSVRVLVVCFF